MTNILCKKRTNRMICGVCAGVADYFAINVTVVRILWAILALAGPALVLYIVAAFALPEEGKDGGAGTQ